MNNSFAELPSLPGSIKSANSDFPSLDIFSKKPTESQILSNPYETTALNKIEGVGRYLNSSAYQKLGYSNNPDLEDQYYKETPWYSQLGNATAQLFGQAAAGFDAQMSKLEQIKETFGTTDSDYLKDAFQASEDLREKYPIFKSSKETYGILGYTPFGEDAGSKWSNFIPNLGFTVGTLGGVFVENAIATAIIEGTTGGVGTPLAAGKWLKGLYDGVKAIKGFNDIKKLASVGRIGAGLYEAEKVLGTAGNIVRGYEALKAGKSLNGALHSIYGGYQLYSAAAGEALIENANSVGELMKGFKDDFIEKNGRNPEGAELAKMQESAEGLILPSSLGNIGILMASNGLQEMNAFKAGKALSTFSTTGSSVLGKTVAKRLILDKTTGLYRDALASEITKMGFKSLSRGALNILSEGAEESAQGVVAEATKNYFKAKYYDKPIGWTDALGQGFAYASSDQGMEEFYAGIVTGGLFSGGGKSINQYQLKKAEKETFKRTGKTIKDLVQDDVTALNDDVVSLLKYNMATSQSSENVKVQTVIQQKMNEAYNKGNKQAGDSFRAAGLFKAMFTAKAYGKDEELLKHYKNLDGLERSELAKYLNVEESELSSSEDFKETLEHLQLASEAVDRTVKKYGNPIKKPNLADPKYAKMEPAEMQEEYIKDTARFESWQAAQELLAGQYFQSTLARKKYDKLKLNLEGTNIPMDLLAAVMSQSDSTSKFQKKVLNAGTELKRLYYEINLNKKAGNKKALKSLNASRKELIQEIKDLKSKTQDSVNPQGNAELNYLGELQKQMAEKYVTLELMKDTKEESDPDVVKVQEELDNLGSEYDIIAADNLSREEKIKALNILRPEDRKFKLNKDNLLSSSTGISTIEEVIDTFNFLGSLKKDIDYSENVIGALDSPQKMTIESQLMLGRIYEARKNLFSNIVEGKTSEDVVDEKLEEKPVEEKKPEEKQKELKKPTAKFKPGNKVEYKNKEYEIQSIKFKDGESIYVLKDAEENTIEVKDAKELTPITETVIELKPIPITREVVEEDEKPDIEAQKADIEKRRQEEFEQYSNDIIISTELYEDGDGRKYLVHTLKNGKRRLDSANEEGKRTSTIDVYERSVPVTKYIYGAKKISDITVTPSKQENRINAKYDAELAKLESKKEETETPETSTDLDQQKADIERRREEELNSNDLYHTGDNLTLENISVEPRVTRQGKKGQYGGLYTYDNLLNIEEFKKGNNSKNTFGINLKNGVEIKDYEGSIERFTKEKLEELRQQGYQVIRGKSLVGTTEIIIIDKSAIESVINLAEVNAKYDAELAALEGKQETTLQEELDTTTTANYSVIAADYLFTAGKGVILSTDYFLQAVIGAFPYAGKKIDEIRNAYLTRLGNLKDDIGTDNYNSAIEEIKNAINEVYQSEEANKLFERIVKNSSGFNSREGNEVSSKIDKLNEEQENKIKAKYEAARSTTTENPIKKSVEDLKELKTTINKAEDLQFTLDFNGTFQSIKQDFIDWQKGLDSEELTEDMKDVLALVDTTNKKEAEEALTKYLLNRYINLQLESLGVSDLSEQKEAEAIKGEPGNSGNINMTEALETINPVVDNGPLRSKEEIMDELATKMADASNRGEKYKLTEEEEKFKEANNSELTKLVNEKINEKNVPIEEEEGEENSQDKRQFLDEFNKLLLITGALPLSTKEAVYNILNRIKFSIADQWFKFKDKEVSINLKSTLEAIATKYPKITFENVGKKYRNPDGKQEIDFYVNRIINNNVKESYKKFELFRFQHSLHLDITKENTELIMDKLMDFASKNDVYVLIGSAYNIARPDNIRIYTKNSWLKDEVLNDLLSDLASIATSKIPNPVINDVQLESLPTTEALKTFLNGIDKSIKEEVLNYLGFRKAEDRTFLDPKSTKNYKNGLSLASLDTAKLFVKAYDKFLLSGKIERQYIIEPVIQQQANKAAFYGEANAIYNELLNNPMFKQIRNRKYFKDLVAMVHAKMEKLKVFNFSNTTLAIGDQLYDDNNTYTIIDHTILGKNVDEKIIDKEISYTKVLKLENNLTKEQTIVNQYEFRTQYSKEPIKETTEEEIKEQEEIERSKNEFNFLPNNLFTTISNDTDIFFINNNGKREKRETLDPNATIGRLVIQRLANTNNGTDNVTRLKFETPTYDDSNSLFYIEPGKRNPNVPERVEEFIIEKLNNKKFSELTPEELEEVKSYFSKIATIVDLRGDYVKYDKNGYEDSNGIIPIFYIPKGELIINGDTISYGGRVLMPISDMVKKEEKTVEEIKQRAEKEAQQLNKLYESETPQLIEIQNISNGVVDENDVITYSEVEELDKQGRLSFRMPHGKEYKGRKGVIYMDLNNTSIELKQKPIGEAVALSILAYLGVDENYLLTKGYKVGKEIKSRLSTLKEEVEKAKENGDTLTVYNAKKDYVDFLNRVVFMGFKNFEVLFDTYFVFGGNSEMFDALSLRDYNTDKKQKEGLPNTFPIGNVWKRLNKNKNNEDYYSYLDTVVDLFSKLKFDTNPTFVESDINDNFVDMNQTLDIKKVDVKQYLMDKYLVRGLLINESLLNSKNRYIELKTPKKGPREIEPIPRTASITTSNGEVDEKALEDRIRQMREKEEENDMFALDIKINKPTISKMVNTKDLTASKEYKDSAVKEIRSALKEIKESLSKDDSMKMMIDLKKAKSKNDVDKIKEEVLDKYNCKK